MAGIRPGNTDIIVLNQQQQKANEGKIKQELLKHRKKSCISKSCVQNTEQQVEANSVHRSKLLQLGF